MEKAQASLETAIAVAIILVIFWGVLIIAIQKTVLGEQTIAENRRFAACQGISETISSIQATEAITDQNIILEDDAIIKQNNIVLGEFGKTSCNYFGTIEGQETGISLSRGTIKISKDAGGKTRVTQIS